MSFAANLWKGLTIYLGFALLLLPVAFGGCVDPGDEEHALAVELLYTVDEWEEIYSLTYSPGGEIIAVGARELELFSVTERRVVRSGKDLEGERPESQSVSFSPDGSMLLAAWRGANLYDAGDLTKLRHLHGGNECRATFSPDGTTLATHPNQTSGEVWLWQAGNGIDFEKQPSSAPTAI